MAVYTHIDEPLLRDFLSAYDFGALVSFRGIAKGVSNTNYHVETTTGPYILTLFEEHRVRAEDLPFYFAFSAHLAGKGIACPQALAARDGKITQPLKGKPAALINFLQGTDITRTETNADHCAQMGVMLARMHNASADFHLTKKNDWGMPAWRALAARIGPRLEGWQAGVAGIIGDELDFLTQHWPDTLPTGAIHGDLFPDNIFFLQGTLNAVIDFYFACTEFFMFDLAIVINAWCFNRENLFQVDRYHALINTYQVVRPLQDTEKKALPLMCRATALRYLLSRLEELFAHDDQTLMQPHDPREYLEKLKFHRDHDVTRF